MRLVNFGAKPEGTARAGVRVGHRILDIESASRVNGEPLPSGIAALLAAGRGAMSRVQSLAKAAARQAGAFSHALHEERAVRLLPPVGDAGLVGHDATVAWPAAAAPLACAPQLVFVIGRRALAVPRHEALDCVAGITILVALDAAASPSASPRELPGLGVLGPEIVTMDEIADPWGLWLSCSVNGRERLRASLHDPVAGLPAMLEVASRQSPLEPGEAFRVGPAGTAPPLALEPGDTVECSLEGIAALRARVLAPGEN